jgi:hypothetical protein
VRYRTAKAFDVMMVDVVVTPAKMTLIGHGDENGVIVSAASKRRVLLHACFMSFQPYSTAVLVIFTLTLTLQKCG